jgi:hypothetical protein
MSRIGPSKDLSEENCKVVRQYVNWLALNPETNSVARLYIWQVGF